MKCLSKIILTGGFLFGYPISFAGGGTIYFSQGKAAPQKP